MPNLINDIDSNTGLITHNSLHSGIHTFLIGPSGLFAECSLQEMQARRQDILQSSFVYGCKQL